MAAVNNYINLGGHFCYQLQKTVAVGEGLDNRQIINIPHVYYSPAVSLETKNAEAQKYDNNGYLLIEEGVEDDIEYYTQLTFKELQRPTIAYDPDRNPHAQDVLLLPCKHKYEVVNLTKWCKQSANFSCMVCKEPIFDPHANQNRQVPAQQEPAQNARAILFQQALEIQIMAEQEYAARFHNDLPDHNVPPQRTLLENLINKVAAFGRRHFWLIIETALVLVLFAIPPTRVFLGNTFLISCLISNLIATLMSEINLWPLYFAAIFCVPLSLLGFFEMIFKVFPAGVLYTIGDVQRAFAFTTIIEHIDFFRR